MMPFTVHRSLFTAFILFGWLLLLKPDYSIERYKFKSIARVGKTLFFKTSAGAHKSISISDYLSVMRTNVFITDREFLKEHGL